MKISFLIQKNYEKEAFIIERINEALTQGPKEAIASLNVILEEIPFFWFEYKHKVHKLIEDLKERI